MDGSRAQRFMIDGLVAGLIGYATVAAFFALLNLLQGRSIFYTAALLGADLFYGLDDPADLTITAGPVLAYNGLHLLAFLIVGALMAWLTRLAERIPQGWYLVGTAFLLVMAHVFGLPIWFDPPVRAAIPLWLVVAASSLAAFAMAAYLIAAHPRLRAGFRDGSDAGSPGRVPG
ncbi:MAG: hypothetical protein ACOC3J_00275 [Gemmatimonadota bacterium]